MAPCPVCGAEQDEDGKREHDVRRHHAAKVAQEAAERRASTGRLLKASCAACGEVFVPTRGARFCSGACRSRSWRARTPGEIANPPALAFAAEKRSTGAGFSETANERPDPTCEPLGELPGTLAWERRQRWLATEAPTREPAREWYATVLPSEQVRHVLVPAGTIPELKKARPWTVAELEEMGPNLRAFILDRNPNLAAAWRRRREEAGRAAA
jgi:hypothetical protein